ncbi:MAG: PIN domain-containing protein [Propionibacteriaceae bacterium]|nr:PIN domain-containing protein [Propionibacteriaceae bacterium]
MHKVLLDTNVVLDFLSSERPSHDLAVSLVTDLQATGIKLCLVATSLKDVYYILGRSDGEQAARQAVIALAGSMNILPVDASCCRQALTSTEPDFEDGIIRAAAEMADVDYVVTRDRRAFIGSQVPRITPADLKRELPL